MTPAERAKRTSSRPNERTRGLDAELRARIAARLADTEQRFTRSREALAAVLAASHRPLTITEISRADPSLAQSSVYRNLTTLEDLGLVHRVITNGDYAHYELAENLTDHHHHHLVCSRCGAVQDIEMSAHLEDAVHQAAQQISRQTGFRTQRHLVDLVGLCSDCV
jgi:Fe2+ or Zn2+ uptake regulation protein